ncbi:DUF2076 domain-containing protein [Ancylobacter terrae]|uniref:DUF2076 domain-containing protein n=1 Tax=Ancylobacter sp. sgz301288 TaxID=3342077 RepID=UPI003858B2D8
MNSEERALIDGLFERLRQVADAPRDTEAEALIAQRVREAPHAPYALAQSVLVQEHALRAANARLEELQAQVDQLQARLDTAPPTRQTPDAAQGSFLGGLFGAGRGTSVPSAGGREGFPVPPSPSAGYGDPRLAPAAPPQSPFARPGFGAGGGGFLSSALTTAAGVAGGALLYDGIRSMMGGSGSPFGGGEAKAAEAPAGAGDTTANTGGDAGSFWNPWGDSGKDGGKDAADAKPDGTQEAADASTASGDLSDPFGLDDHLASTDDTGFDGGLDGGYDDTGWA